MSFSAQVVASGTVTYAAADGNTPPSITTGVTLGALSRGFLKFTEYNDDTTAGEYRPGRHVFRGYCDSTTTIKFIRGTSASAKNVHIEWELIEFSADVSVEVIHADLGAQAVNDFAFSITSDISRSLLFWSMGSTATNINPLNTEVFLQKTGAQNQLRLLHPFPATQLAAGECVVTAQIIQFAATDINSIQRGTTSIGSGVQNATQTITAVDLSKSILNLSAAGTNANFDWDTRVRCQAKFNSTTQLQFDRGVEGGSSNIEEVRWEVVEFAAGVGISCQQNLVDMTGLLSTTLTLGTAVDLARSTTWPVCAWSNAYQDPPTGSSGGQDGCWPIQQRLTSTTVVTMTRGSLYTNDGTHVYVQTIQWPAAGGGAAPVDLTPEDEIAGPSIDPVSALQVGALGVSDAVATGAIDLVSLVRIYALAAEDAAAAAALDSAGIVQAYGLIAADSTSAPSTDPAALTQVHILVTVDLGSVPVIDDVAIPPPGIIDLSAADALVSASLDSVAAIQVMGLSVDDMVSDAAVDVITAVQVAALIAENLVARGAGDPVGLAQIHILIAEELLTQPASDDLAAVQVHALLPGDMATRTILDDTILSLGALPVYHGAKFASITQRRIVSVVNRREAESIHRRSTELLH